jgi:flagellin-specific chaperone FliS
MTDKEKIDKLSTIITNLWDIFSEEDQKEISKILDEKMDVA